MAATKKHQTLTDKLNRQTELFCKEYIEDLNGKQAAIRAGYSAKTAEVKASQLLSLVKVQVFIQELMKARERRTEITADMVVKELAKIAFHDIRKLYNKEGRLKDISELDDETSSVIASFKARREFNKEDKTTDIIEEYKKYDKIKSLELLGKHLGIFEKDNSQKPTGNTTIVQIVEDKQDD